MQFKPKHLEFVYLLSKANKLMNSSEMSKYLQKLDFDVSDRTINQWFKEDPVSVAYALEPNYVALGLRFAVIRVFGLKNRAFFDLVPNCFFIHPLNSLATHHIEYVMYCAVPPESYQELVKFFEVAKEKGIIDRFDFFDRKHSLYNMSTLHKIVSPEGKLDFSKAGPSLNEELFSEYLNCQDNIEVIEGIRKNPIILPVLLESENEFPTSSKLWDSIKTKLSDRVWEFIPDYKYKSDGVGIAKVKEALREVKSRQHTYYDNARVVYQPLLLNDFVLSFVDITLKNREEYLELAKELTKRTLSTVFMFSPLDSNRFMIGMVTSFLEQSKIVTDIFPRYAHNQMSRVAYYDKAEARKLFAEIKSGVKKMDYTLYNPKTNKWSFDITKSLESLDTFEGQPSSET